MGGKEKKPHHQPQVPRSSTLVPAEGEAAQGRVTSEEKEGGDSLFPLRPISWGRHGNGTGSTQGDGRKEGKICPGRWPLPRSPSPRR